MYETNEDIDKMTLSAKDLIDSLNETHQVGVVESIVQMSHQHFYTRLLLIKMRQKRLLTILVTARFTAIFRAAGMQCKRV